jgi:hypothetical protein
MGIQSDADFKVRCTKCGEVWEVPHYYETGGWFPCNDDDLICSNHCDDAETEDVE